MKYSDKNLVSTFFRFPLVNGYAQVDDAQYVDLYTVMKRILDVILSFFLLFLLLPFFGFVALFIKCSDGGPVLFWQVRTGCKGHLFQIPKFRTMIPNAEEQKSGLMVFNERKDGKAFKMRNDPRVTRIGRILRRFSIDELPQLWNVLKGDMSLVGPRPPIPEEVELYNERELKRLCVKPGLTGLWQIGGRADLSFSHQVQMDLEYIRTHSLWLDVKILLKTIPAVLRGKGAY